jgi:MSHA biogenesis protein MshQ
VTVNNSFRDVRFQIRSPVGGPYTQIGCSTDRFSIRPQSLTISALDANWETAGTARALNNIGATGGNVHKASEISATTPRPFTLRATPVPASATNYDGSPTTVSGFPTCGALCTTAGGLNFTAGSWTSAGGGVRDNATANYSEAGTFNLQLEDSTYASVDAVDGTPAATRTVPSTGTVQIGRFVPERFEFTSPGTPTLLTFNDGICSSRSFTYIGQPFWYVAGGRPAATLNAVNAAGTVTSNYTLDVASSKPAISEIYADGTAPAAAPLVTTSIGTPTVTSGSGTGTYLASLSGQLSYSRSTTTPVGLFNSAISLTVTASDATDSAASGNGTINTPSSLVFNGGGSGIAFDSGAQFRYGRLRIGNANGSQLVPLLVRLETQYWSGPPSNAFITNAADSCTTLAGTNITMGNFQGNLGPLASCKTNINANVTFAAGRGNLQLTAPGSGNGGSVDLTVQLGSGAFGSNSCVSPGSPPPQATIGANRAYLQGNWTGGLFTQDPTGRASFGQFKGAEEVIYIRENF